MYLLPNWALIAFPTNSNVIISKTRIIFLFTIAEEREMRERIGYHCIPSILLHVESLESEMLDQKGLRDTFDLPC